MGEGQGKGAHTTNNAFMFGAEQEKNAPVTARAVLLGLFGAAAVSGFEVVSKAQPQPAPRVT
jgi:hypothetical protein